MKIKQKIQIALLGARGKMGRSNILEILKYSDLNILFALVKDEDPFLGKKLSDDFDNFFNDSIYYTSDLEAALLNSDVCVDFSSVEGTLELLKKNKIYKKPLIIGTTGLTKDIKEKMQKESKHFAVVYDSNFSYLMNVFFLQLTQLASLLKEVSVYDIDIIEEHHRFKKDKPSGTAIKLKEVFQDSLKEEAQKITMHSLRQGSINGVHEFRLTDLTESLRISHHAYSRSAFSKGVVLALKWIYHQKNGFYSMKNVLSF